MTQAPRKDETQASEEAKALWAFLWARVKNLHPATSARMVRTVDAPEDIPAPWEIQDVLDRVSRERTRQALERAAKLEAALQVLADYSEPPFDHPPEEWAKHTPETCAECAEWKARKHPIQHACDGFYRLLHSRDDHRAFDRQAEGPRMRMIARKALQGLSDGESVASEEKEE